MKFENWEQYCAGKLALGEAIDYSLSWGMESIQQRVYNLADSFRRKLSEIDSIILTDQGVEKCGIVTFVCERLEPSEVKTSMAKHKINISTSKGSGSLVSFQSRGIREVVRASVHYFNTEDEIDYFIEVLNGLVRRKI